MKNPLKNISTEVILNELLNRHLVRPNDTDDHSPNHHFDNAPTKINFFGKHYEVTIGIGKDNIFRLFFTPDDLVALSNILKVKRFTSQIDEYVGQQQPTAANGN